MHRKDKHEGRKAKSAAATAAKTKSREAGSAAATAAAGVTCPYCKKKFKQWQYLNVHKKKCAAAKLQYQVSKMKDTPGMVYNGHLKFQTSVSLRIPLYGSRNLAYIACKMDHMCPF